MRGGEGFHPSERSRRTIEPDKSKLFKNDFSAHLHPIILHPLPNLCYLSQVVTVTVRQRVSKGSDKDPSLKSGFIFCSLAMLSCQTLNSHSKQSPRLPARGGGSITHEKAKQPHLSVTSLKIRLPLPKEGPRSLIHLDILSFRGVNHKRDRNRREMISEYRIFGGS